MTYPVTLLVLAVLTGAGGGHWLAACLATLAAFEVVTWELVARQDDRNAGQPPKEET